MRFLLNLKQDEKIKNWTDQDMIDFAQQAINNLTKRGIFDKELDKLPKQLEKYKDEVFRDNK